MNLQLIAAIFAILGVIDRLFGNRLHLGEGFEKGIKLAGSIALAMVGMIVIAPVLADLVKPLLSGGGLFDPSLVPAVMFSNDMGGASLAMELSHNPEVGMMNAMLVSAMMGCTVSFTIPASLAMTDSKYHRFITLGILCGLVTIPIGCFVGGCIAGVPVLDVFIDILPVTVLAVVIVIALIKFPNASIKGFRILGFCIDTLIAIGLVLGLLDYMLDYRPIENIGSYQDGFDIVIYACTVIAGMLPLLHIMSVVLKKPLALLGKLLGVNEKTALGFLSSLATSVTTFERIPKMDEKGIMLNSAFAVSGAFVLAGHLAYTMSFNAEYVLPVIVGKLVAGVTAVALCALLYPSFRKMLAKDN